MIVNKYISRLCAKIKQHVKILLLEFFFFCANIFFDKLYIKMNVCLYVPFRLEDMYLPTVTSTVPGGRIDPLYNYIIVNCAFDYVMIFRKIVAHEPMKVSKLI